MRGVASGATGTVQTKRRFWRRALVYLALAALLGVTWLWAQRSRQAVATEELVSGEPVTEHTSHEPSAASPTPHASLQVPPTNATLYFGIPAIATLPAAGAVPMVDPSCGPIPNHEKPFCSLQNQGRDITRAPGRWCKANPVWLQQAAVRHLARSGVWFWTVDSCQLRWFSMEEAADCLNHHKHVVFVGDSLSRYMYLNLAFFITHGVWPHPTGRRKHVPDIANEHEWARFGGWNKAFYPVTTSLLKHETCDCFREEKNWKSSACENRAYSFDTFGVHMTYLQSWGDNPLKGHGEFPLSQEGLHCTPGTCGPQVTEAWRTSLASLPTGPMATFRPKVYNCGLWGCDAGIVRNALRYTTKAFPHARHVWRATGMVGPSTSATQSLFANAEALEEAARKERWEVFQTRIATGSATMQGATWDKSPRAPYGNHFRGFVYQRQPAHRLRVPNFEAAAGTG